MNKTKNIYTHTFSPESHLLYLYSEGVPQHNSPTEEDMINLVSGLKKNKMSIYFSQFWRHDEVQCFKSRFSNDIIEDDLIHYLSKVNNLLLARNDEDVHWIEKINIFHFYGLMRIFGVRDKSRSLTFINKFIDQSKYRNKSLIYISAINAKSVLEERDSNDIIEVFSEFKKNPYLIRDFGIYQVYYYKNIHNCINNIRNDLNHRGKVPIPHSVLALLVVCDLLYKDESILKEEIMDELYYKLTNDVKIKIDKLYNEFKGTLKINEI
jgi:hypothetical protein